MPRKAPPAPRERVAGRWERLVDWFVPASSVHSGSTNVWRLITSLALVLVPTLLSFAIHYIFIGVYIGAVALSVSAMAVLGLMLHSRRTGNYERSTGGGVIVLVLIVGVLSLLRGSFNLSAVMWLGLMPVSAYFVLGVRWLRISATISLVVGTACYLLPATGLTSAVIKNSPAVRSRLEFMSWCFFVIIATAIPFFFAKLQRIHREEELLRTSALERSRRMQAVGALAAGVAHEFNNLLTVIAGNAGIMKRGESLSQDAVEDLNAIEEAAQIGAKLTKDLLSLSRDDDGDAASCQLADAVNSSLRLLGPTLGRGIEVNVDVEENLPAVPASRQAVEQIIINLALNARDAMGDGGRIDVVIRQENLRGLAAHEAGVEAGTWQRLSVSDTGHGMGADTLERIFDPFYTARRDQSGTGLGLSIVFGMVERADGTIRVASELDVGTRFDVYLPVCATQKERSEPMISVPMSALAERRRVLIVEDEPLVRRIACRLLEKAGYEIAQAESGAEALDVLGESRFDLVITDVRMPGISGTQLASEVRDGGNATPFLFMSGHLDESMLDYVRSTFGSDLLTKPFSPKQLTAAVALAMGEAPTSQSACSP